MKPSELKKLLQIPSDEPDLTLAQFFVSAKKIPLLYFLLTVNIWVLAVPFMGLAPAYLALYIPLILTAFNVFRLSNWWQARHKRPTVKLALDHLRRTNRLAPLLAGVYASWSLALFPYGDSVGQGHVALFMGVTILACIICLMHIRSAAIMVTVIMAAAYIIFFSYAGNSIFVAEAVNMASVAVAMLFMIGINFGDFRNLIASRKKLLDQRKELVKKHFETQKLSDENFRLANVDDLTGLPNRRYFFSELDQCRKAAKENGELFSVGLLDLNGFKTVNDMFGHAVGDYLLKEVATRLTDYCGENVFVARLGGDEFALLIRGKRTPSELEECGLELHQVLAPVVHFSEAEIALNAAVGFARFLAENGGEGLYERADYALYQAKRGANAGVVVFGMAHHQEIQRTRQIERAFHLPDFESEIEVFFQPIVDSCTGEILSFEALARWENEQLGKVPPFEFIPVAENTGFIDKLTLLLLRKALAAANTWPSHVGLSFNLSAKNIATRHTVPKILQVVRESGIEPTRIDFEITETAMLNDFKQVQWCLDQLKACGANIALDDFGTGFSSLSHLHMLPLDKIKIDRSFVSNIGHNSAGYDIVKSLISLALDMQIGCIVEGVETKLEMQIVRDLGAKMVQGYYVSKPLPEADAEAFLRSYCCTGNEQNASTCFG